MFELLVCGGVFIWAVGFGGMLIAILVLGLNDATAARKLVRLLLADPLTPRGSWEDILDNYDADTSQGLLIRYGIQVAWSASD